MHPRISLLTTATCLIILVVLAYPPGAQISSPAPTVSYEKLLQGTWGLRRIEQKWIVTDQAPDSGPRRSAARHGLPETWDAPSIPQIEPVIITFAGERYRTREDGRVVDYGTFRIERRLRGSVLETRAEDAYGWPVRPMPVRAWISGNAAEVRLTLGDLGRRLLSGPNLQSEDEVVVVLRRLAP